jgi:hypothetical protein
VTSAALRKTYLLGELAKALGVVPEDLPPVFRSPTPKPLRIGTYRALRDHGHTVYATDLVPYDSPDQDESGWDFLLEQQLPIGVEAIITNPPFKLAGEFVEHAIRLCPRVFMLLRLAFLESERRTPILDSGNLARVYVFKSRLPMMHRAGWQGPRASSSKAFAWFCWDSRHVGPTQLVRL